MKSTITNTRAHLIVPVLKTWLWSFLDDKTGNHKEFPRQNSTIGSGGGTNSHPPSRTSIVEIAPCEGGDGFIHNNKKSLHQSLNQSNLTESSLTISKPFSNAFISKEKSKLNKQEAVDSDHPEDQSGSSPRGSPSNKVKLAQSQGSKFHKLAFSFSPKLAIKNKRGHSEQSIRLTKMKPDVACDPPAKPGKLSKLM